MRPFSNGWIAYTGTVEPNHEQHHGGLAPVPGAHHIQVLRANREHPERAEGTGWTYNHAPDLAFWRGAFYLMYLSNPVGEHQPPGQAMLTTSRDGFCWDKPIVAFPPLRVPAREGYPSPAVEYAIVHHRICFFIAPSGRMLLTTFYGISETPHSLPFDQNGVGRVIREIHEDGLLGPIYFLHLNVHAGWRPENVPYPWYESAEDGGLVEACRAFLENPLLTQQFSEEHGASASLETLRGDLQAFCYYTLPDGQRMGLWKWAKAAPYDPLQKRFGAVRVCRTLRTAGGKIWGQRTPDGRYALFYNPTTDNKHRWPLAVVTGEDGRHFSHMRCAVCEVPPCRYAGKPFKDPGINYVRGMLEENGQSEQRAVWIAYSINKEDIWVSRLPSLLQVTPSDDVADHFAAFAEGPHVPGWNVYAPLDAKTAIEKVSHGKTALVLRDSDPYDYAKAERIFAASGEVWATVSVRPMQTDGELYLELCDERSVIPVRVVFTAGGEIRVRHGRGETLVAQYEAGRTYAIGIRADAAESRFFVTIDGAETGAAQSYQGVQASGAGWFFFAAARALHRLTLRTGPVRREPTPDSAPPVSDLPNAGERVKECVFEVDSVRVQTGAKW